MRTRASRAASSLRQRVEEHLHEPDALRELLVSLSGLPGPRLNLELTAAFADAIEARGPERAPWALLYQWAELSPVQAPTNHPTEILPFAALRALGALCADATQAERGRILATLEAHARSRRWRTREAVAMALQRVGERDFELLQQVLEPWAEASCLYKRRALLAALAHPPLLADPARAEWALGLADGVLCEFARSTERGAEAWTESADENAGERVDERVDQREPGYDPEQDASDFDTQDGEQPRPRRRQRVPKPKPKAKVRPKPKPAPGSEQERMLQKALEYAPSVLIAALPEQGFALLRRWACMSSMRVKRIVAANLRKARLAKQFAAQCEEIGEVLGSGTE
jgi:hypothetical protein